MQWYVLDLILLAIGVVCVVSRFLDNPGNEHWEVVKWILRYLRGSLDE